MKQLENTIYVSPMGSGDKNGSAKEHAIGGIFNAIETARTLKKPVTIKLLPGEYSIHETINLDERDSFTTFEGMNAVITSGLRIANWETCGGNIISAKIPEDLRPTRLYIDHKPAERARYPEEGYSLSYEYAVDPNGWANILDDPNTDEIRYRQFRFLPEDLPFDLEEPDNAEFVILSYWMETRLYLEKLDRIKGEALFKEGSWRPLAWSFGYYIDNVKEGLKTPGRWYFDKKESRIYYHLNENETMESIDAVCPTLQHLVSCAPESKAQEIRFEGITFAHTNAAKMGECHYYKQAELQAPCVLYFANTDKVSIVNCKLENLGGYALWIAKGCNDANVEYCQFNHLGAGAVRIGEETKPTNKAQYCDRHTIQNNLIANCGQQYLGAAGIWVGQSGYNTISHNDLSGALQWGISVGWNWSYFPLNRTISNKITDNYIHDLGTGVLGTHGAIYILGVSPETLIERNYIRNVYATPHWGAGQGVILDNGCSGITIQNNIILNAVAGGWGCNFNCFGNIIRNNIMCYGQKYQLTRYGDPSWDEIPPPNGEVFAQNIILWEEGPLFPVEWGSYSTLWNYNLYWKTTGSFDFLGKTFEQWKRLGLDKDSIVADPLFKDAKNGDFTLSEDSPAFSIGFEPFTLDDVGVIPKD